MQLGYNLKSATLFAQESCYFKREREMLVRNKHGSVMGCAFFKYIYMRVNICCRIKLAFLKQRKGRRFHSDKLNLSNCIKHEY